MSAEQFDYIVVGGGSAGAVLATRLTENPAVTVCLLEAGNPDKNPLIHIPFGLSLISRIQHLDWGYYTAPQTQLDGREMFWPRGKTLGGSSSVNAMCYIRGHIDDYNHWAEQGAAGWTFDEVLPYFKKAENYFAGSDEFHGTGGPLNVDALRHSSAYSRAFVNAAEHVNLPQREDFNRDERDGLGLYHVTQINGQRCSTAKGYLSQAKHRHNLTIITQAAAEKVLIKNGVATGVQYRQKGKLHRAMAKCEVLLCGGAVNSPQLLMLSGIGPREHLEDLGIFVQVDLPGVGQNLQDHLDAIVQYRCKAKEGYAVALSALPRYVKAGWDYLMHRNGIFSSNVAEGGGFARSSLATFGPDLQFHFLPAILQDHGRKFVFGHGYGLHVCALYPESRGEIRLQSSHPADSPLIDPKYLTHDNDKQVMIDGVRLANAILQAPSFEPFDAHLSVGEHSLESDEDIVTFIQDRGETIYHPVGTCKMGASDDEMAVVDPQLKVRGVANLRVVDASVMPSLVGGNTNAPTVMIAERAADWIKSTHQKG